MRRRGRGGRGVVREGDRSGVIRVRVLCLSSEPYGAPLDIKLFLSLHMYVRRRRKVEKEKEKKHATTEAFLFVFSPPRPPPPPPPLLFLSFPPVAFSGLALLTLTINHVSMGLGLSARHSPETLALGAVQITASEAGNLSKCRSHFPAGNCLFKRH